MKADSSDFWKQRQFRHHKMMLEVGYTEVSTSHYSKDNISFFSVTYRAKDSAWMTVLYHSSGIITAMKESFS